MKMTSTLFTFCAGLLMTSIVYAQSPIIFQPGPGANDGSDQGGLNSGKDAFVYEGNPSANYGTDPVVLALPISNCNSTHATGFIQFDVSTLPANVDSVVVGFNHLPHTNYCLSNCVADFYFARVTQPWDEMTVTYSNQPGADTTFYGPINVSFPNSFGVREYNITSTYLAWKNGTAPNHGFVIYSTTVGCNNAAVYFEPFSSDDSSATNRPYLKIYVSGTGVNSVANTSLQFSMAPNPAQDYTTVRFTLSENETAVFRLTDVTGRAVTEAIPAEGAGAHEMAVPLTGLNPGVYFYTLETKQGIITGKLTH